MRLFRTIATVLLICFALTACVNKTPQLRKQSEALRNLGEVYMSQGNLTSAIREFLEAESLFADDFLLQDDLGKAYTAKERYEDALVYFQRSIELQPDYAPAKNNMGSVYLLMKRWDEAIVVLSQVSEDILYATPHFPIYNLGWAYHNKKMYKKARGYYQRALNLQPNFILPMRGMALTFLAEGRMSDAISWFEQATTLAPDFQQLQYEMAGAYLKAHQYAKAKTTLALVVEMDAESRIGLRALRELNALTM